MKLLVIGRNGQVARALARADLSLATVDRVEFDLEQPGNANDLMARHQPDFVINAAAYTAVDRAENERERAFAVNAAGAEAIARAAAARGAGVLHISTDYVFSGDKNGAYIESDPTGPRSVYGASKLEGERFVLAANPCALILRTSWVFDAKGSNFVRTMLRLAHTRDAIAVVADQHGCPTFANDIAAAILRIASAAMETRRFGVYHCTGAGATTWADFADAVFAASRARGGPFAAVEPIPTSAYLTAAPRPANSVLDCSKLKVECGIALRSWREALEDCMDEIAAGGWSVG